jgi:hypothetical protein
MIMIDYRRFNQSLIRLYKFNLIIIMIAQHDWIFFFQFPLTTMSVRGRSMEGCADFLTVIVIVSESWVHFFAKVLPRALNPNSLS